MPDLSNYPIQGKLRIRQDGYERAIAYLTPRVGYLSPPELKSIAGYDFLKFWYADFAATPEQWAEVAPELDKQNVLVTLYEAPVNYMEVEPEEEEAERAAKPASRLTLIYGGLAIAIMLGTLGLLLAARIDSAACLALSCLAGGVLLVGQVHGWIMQRGRRKDAESVS